MKNKIALFFLVATASMIAAPLCADDTFGGWRPLKSAENVGSHVTDKGKKPITDIEKAKEDAKDKKSSKAEATNEKTGLRSWSKKKIAVVGGGAVIVIGGILYYLFGNK